MVEIQVANLLAFVGRLLDSADCVLVGGLRLLAKGFQFGDLLLEPRSHVESVAHNAITRLPLAAIPNPLLVLIAQAVHLNLDCGIIGSA